MGKREKPQGSATPSGWRAVATAPDQTTAEMWCARLRASGIAAMLDPSGAVSFLGVSATPVRVLVRAEQEAEAREALGEEE